MEDHLENQPRNQVVIPTYFHNEPKGEFIRFKKEENINQNL